MKKLVLFACAAIALASCGNKTASNDASADSAAVDTAAVASAEQAVADSITNVLQQEIQTAQQDPSKLQATLAQAQVIYANLVKEGKVEEAKKYASAVQEFINNNAESIKTAANNATVSSLIDGIKNLPTSADATADAALKAVSADAQTIANGAKDAAVNTATNAVENAKSTAKAAVDNQVNAAKTAVNNKVNEAKQKASDKVNEATNKANAAANKAISDGVGKLLGK